MRYFVINQGTRHLPVNICGRVLDKTILPPRLAEYHIIVTNSVLHTSLVISILALVSTEINNDNNNYNSYRGGLSAYKSKHTKDEKKINTV